MSAPIGQTETDRANAALAHIGEPAIVSLDDTGRAAARECKRHFAAVRDQFLRKANWQFAKASASPATVGAPVDNAYLYRYPMPTDCLAVRAIRDAREGEWEVRHAGNDGDPRVMVDSDIEAPLIFYTRRVTNPAQWDELFCEVFDLALAARVNPNIGRDKSLTERLKNEAETRLLSARQREIRERAPERVTRETSWTRVRRGGFYRGDKLKG